MKLILSALALAVVIVVVATWLHRFSDARLKRLAEKHLAGRPSRAGLEFGETFYPDHVEVAAQVRDVLTKHLPLDLSRLEPTDQLVDELKMDDLDSMSTVEFIVALEERFGISIADADAEKMRTFHDICTHAIAKLEEKRCL